MVSHGSSQFQWCSLILVSGLTKDLCPFDGAQVMAPLWISYPFFGLYRKSNSSLYPIVLNSTSAVSYSSSDWVALLSLHNTNETPNKQLLGKSGQVFGTVKFTKCTSQPSLLVHTLCCVKKLSSKITKNSVYPRNYCSYSLFCVLTNQILAAIT